MRDEDPGEQRHRERLHEPVDTDRRRDAAPMLADLAQRGGVDLEQHRDNHQPDQYGDRQIDLGYRRLAESMKDARHHLAQDHSGYDAERHPQSEETFEYAHG